MVVTWPPKMVNTCKSVPFSRTGWVVMACSGSCRFSDTACHSHLHMHLLIHHLVCSQNHLRMHMSAFVWHRAGQDDPEYGSLTQHRVRSSGGTWAHFTWRRICRHLQSGRKGEQPLHAELLVWVYPCQHKSGPLWAINCRKRVGWPIGAHSIGWAPR